MEEKLKKILDTYEEKIEWHEKQVEKLVTKMEFFKTHNLEEEYRIADIKYQAIKLCVNQFREMHKEIKDLLKRGCFKIYTSATQ